MERKHRGRAGIAFFTGAVALIFTAILATVLLANEQRNLKQLLAALGLPASTPEPEEPPAPPRPPPRMPPPQVMLPERIFADLDAPEQQFLRQIRSNPRALCDGLRDAGFRDLEWTAAESGRWECSSLVPFPRPGEEKSSSIFIFVKGSDQDEISSFRVKLNIEHPEDAQAVTSAAARAASVFLTHVRWADRESIALKIQALDAFDLERFGSRIRFAQESGETPRYNFLANQGTETRAKTIAGTYFDREKWLTPGDGSPVTFVLGPAAWNAGGAGRNDRR